MTTDYKQHQKDKILRFADRFSPFLPYAIPPKSRRVYLKCARCPALATYVYLDGLYCEQHVKQRWDEEWEMKTFNQENHP